MENSACSTEIAASRAMGLVLLPFALVLLTPLILLVPVLGGLAGAGILAVAGILTAAPRGRACRLPART